MSTENLSFIRHPKFEIFGLVDSGKIVFAKTEPPIFKYRYFYDEGFGELYSYANDEMKIYPKDYDVLKIEEYLKEAYLKNQNQIGCNTVECEKETEWIRATEPPSSSDKWTLKYQYRCEICEKLFCQFHSFIKIENDERHQYCEPCLEKI